MQNHNKVIGACLAFGVLVLSSCQQQTEFPGAYTPNRFSVFSGLQLANIDHSIRPGDDLYRFANGQWLETFTLPADRPGFGVFSSLADQVEVSLRQIVTAILLSPPGDLNPGEANLKNLYLSFMDIQVIDQKGISPLLPLLEEIGGIADTPDLTGLFATLSVRQLAQPFQLFVEENPQNSNQFLFHLEQAGLGMPGRSFYFDIGAEAAAVRVGYLEYITRLFSLGGFSEPAQRADNVLDLETTLARAQWSLADTRDKDLGLNLYTLAELETLMPGFDWRVYFDRIGQGIPGQVVVRQPGYFSALDKMLEDYGIEVWRDYFRFQLLNDFARFLPRAFVDAHFDFFQRTLQNVQAPTPRRREGFNLINAAFGDVLGQAYVRDQFDPGIIPGINGMASNLKTAFAQKLEANTWMSATTRDKAFEKLDKMTIKIGAPEVWRDYSALSLSPDALIENIIEFQMFDFNVEAKKLTHGRLPGRWTTSPQTVNAYYNAPQNEIVIPAAILAPPLYNPEVDDAANYGALGGIIGHEIIHAFDDQGRKIDGDGNHVNWWSAADEAAFEVRAENISALYSSFSPLPGLTIDGAQTLGENIGDIEGLELAYEAYKISLSGAPSSRLAGFSGEQRLFISWAQIWAQKMREAELRNRLLTGFHSPGEFRVNGVVRNLPGFYEAFDVVPGDLLYLPEDQRLGIW